MGGDEGGESEGRAMVKGTLSRDAPAFLLVPPCERAVWCWDAQTLPSRKQQLLSKFTGRGSCLCLRSSLPSIHWITGISRSHHVISPRPDNYSRRHQVSQQNEHQILEMERRQEDVLLKPRECLMRWKRWYLCSCVGQIGQQAWHVLESPSSPAGTVVNPLSISLFSSSIFLSLPFAHNSQKRHKQSNNRSTGDFKAQSHQECVQIFGDFWGVIVFAVSQGQKI